MQRISKAAVDVFFHQMPVIPLYNCGVLQAILCVSMCVFELRRGGEGTSAGAATTHRQTAQGNEKESERAATFNLHPDCLIICCEKTHLRPKVTVPPTFRTASFGTEVIAFLSLFAKNDRNAMPKNCATREKKIAYDVN